ncbi:hypothetical protein ACWEPB_07495 [Kitasatospora cineracea]|uniref:hypothetical protein n=1 Tax=unclassified Kitasatospora TaxID=2633591 RepID=UPI0004C2FDF6|nr:MULTISPECIES: hypothetical protein [unclassified Kitasatospora]WAL73251.1 hypothetical protein OU787_18125 [Kitasatospora sp. YST-16]WNW39305.1 hypothetical protein RKE32_18085 [Streptomyces sp. Li-HN-5-13]
MASGESGTRGHDRAALDEIDLAGELMIAASASRAERLAAEQIDEVLLARHRAPGPAGDGPADGDGRGSGS